MCSSDLILNILKGLPSGYNRDFQETKRPFMEGLRLTSACVRVMHVTFTKLEVREERLVAAFQAAPDVFATDEALRLVVEGMPFRDAYRQVAASLDSLQAADPRASIAQRTHAGGPANLQLDLADEAIRHLKEFADQRRDRLQQVGDALFGKEKTGSAEVKL